jgi:hypothetical protein
MVQQTEKNVKPMTYWVSKNDDNKEEVENILYFAGNITALVIAFILFRLLIEINL